MAPRGAEEVILEPAPAAGQPRPEGRPTKLVRVKMPIYERFVATKSEKMPSYYAIPAQETHLIEALRRHGVVVDKLVKPGHVIGQRFTFTDVKVGSRPFQGHRLTQATGSFSPVEEVFPSGSYVVRLNQPLNILIFNLLEPESTDGAVTWGMLAAPPAPGAYYQITKGFGKIDAVTERIP